MNVLSAIEKNVFVNVILNDLVCFIGKKVIILTLIVREKQANDIIRKGLSSTKTAKCINQ